MATPRDQLPLDVAQLFVPADLADLMQGYMAASRTAGDPVEVLAPPGANHFDVITPSKPNGAKVLDFIVDRAFAARP